MPSRTLSNHQVLELIPSLRSFVARRVSKQDVVDDIVQETLTRTYKSADFSDMVKPLGYLVTVANSVLAEHWRKHQTESLEVLDNEPPAELCLESVYINNERLMRVAEALEAMPPMRRQVFVLRRLKGLSRSEIARSMNINEEAVKKHITRAMVDITLATEQGRL